MLTRGTFIAIRGSYSSMFVKATLDQTSITVVVDSAMKRPFRLIGIHDFQILFSDILEMTTRNSRILPRRTRLVVDSSDGPYEVLLSRWVGEALSREFPGRW
jgi:hypothetical protein